MTKFICHRCGMGFLEECPVGGEEHELLRCDCGIAFGSTTSIGAHSNNPVVCWLIREGGARWMKGVRKIA